MPALDFDFRDRPVVALEHRLFALLDDVQPALGLQLLSAADVTGLLSRTNTPRKPISIPVWHDGAGVCYVRPPSGRPARVGVLELPIWVGLQVPGGLGHLTRMA